MRRHTKFGLGCVGNLLVAVGLMYWGWCWGWWGQENLLFTYLFQCNCPHGSEEVRWRPFKVLISACNTPGIGPLSPSGKYARVSDNIGGERLYDFEAWKITHIPPKWGGITISEDEHIFLQGNRRDIYYLVDADTSFSVSVPISYFQGVIDDSFLRVVKEAEQIINIGEGALFLGHDYLNQPQENQMLLSKFGNITPLLEQLETLGVYHPIIKTPWVSHNQLFVAEQKGLTLAKTGEFIVPIQSPVTFQTRDWVIHDQGAIYRPSGPRYVFDFKTLTIGGPQFLRVDFPLLFLELPPEYRNLPVSTPTP